MSFVQKRPKEKRIRNRSRYIVCRGVRKISSAAQHLLSFRTAELAAGERTNTDPFCEAGVYQNTGWRCLVMMFETLMGYITYRCIDNILLRKLSALSKTLGRREMLFSAKRYGVEIYHFRQPHHSPVLILTRLL